jgi:biotin carboxyl carrier protein
MRKYELSIGDNDYKAEVKEFTEDFARIVVNDIEYEVTLKEFGRKEVTAPRQSERPAASKTPVAPKETKRPVPVGVNGGAEGIRSPLPGLIVDVLVKEGDSVKAGQNMMVMEAMKMENQIQAPHDGTVKKVFVDKGDTVAEDDVLIELCRPPHTTL